MFKTCTKCGTAKALEAFPLAKRAKDGRDTRCKACACLATKAYAEANPDKVKLSARASYLKNAKARDARVAAWRAENPERSAAHKKKWRDQNLELAREIERAWRERCRAEMLEHKRAYAKANRSKYAAYATQRKAAKLRATPAWADPAAILAVYEKAAAITKSTGQPHEVDHIVPLQGETVCGLHVACNLRVVTRIENRRKHNRVVDHV